MFKISVAPSHDLTMLVVTENSYLNLPVAIFNHGNKFSDVNVKPPYSYVAMIAMSIQDSKHGKLKLCHIYDYIKNKFPYYKHQASFHFTKSNSNHFSHFLFFPHFRRPKDGRIPFGTILV